MIVRAACAVACAVAFLATSFVVEAQQTKKVARVGVLHPIEHSFDVSASAFDRALVEGLREHGWVIGRDFEIEFRGADGHPERLASLAAALVAKNVDVLVTQGTPATLAARQATTSMPIVMVGVADPVAVGIVASLAHPGGNLTGLAINAAESNAKRVQLLKEAVPKLSRVAVLWNATFSNMALGFQHIERAAPSLGVTIQSVRVAGPEDFDKAFAAIGERRPDGLIVLYGPMRGTDLPRLTDFTTRNRLPAVFDSEQGARDGGFMTFGARPGLAHEAGRYIDKILKGAKPADLPVEEPRTHQLIINLRTAKALGLTIPPALLLRADQVIE